MKEAMNDKRYYWELASGCLPGVTNDPHALIEVQGILYAVWADADNDGKLFYMTYDKTSSSWSKPYRIGRKEDDEYTRTWEVPSVASLNGSLIVCWHRLHKWEMYTTKLHGGTWSKTEELKGHVADYTSPSFISTPKGDLVVFAGRNGQVWYSYRKTSSEPWPAEERVGDTDSNKTPTLIPLNQDLSLIALYWTDTSSGDIRLRLWDAENGWHKDHSVIHKNVADTGPAVCWIGDTLCLAWSKDSRILYSYTIDGVHWSLPERIMFYDDLFYNTSSEIDRGVILGVFDNELHLGFVRNKRTRIAKYTEAKPLTFVVLPDVHVTDDCTDPTTWQTNLFLVDAIKKKLPTMTQEGTGQPFGDVDFALITGDLTYSEGLVQKYVDNFYQMFSRLGMPIHVVAGNHDTTQSNWRPISTDLFDRIRKANGGSYPYTFDCKGLRFVALRGDEHLPHDIDFRNEETNNRFLDEELQVNEHTPVIAMCHYGFDKDFTIPNWTREKARQGQIDRLKNRNFVAYFSGHSHISCAWEIPELGKNRNLVGGTSTPPEHQHQFWAVRIVGRTIYASLISWSGKVGTIWTETIDLKYLDNTREQARLLTWTF